MSEGNLVNWLVKEGDSFNAGDSIGEIETDKATVPFETTDDGYMAKILVPGGTDDVTVGTPVCIVVEEAEDIAAFANYEPEAQEEPPAPPASATATAAAEDTSSHSSKRQPSIQFRHGDREGIAKQLAASAATSPFPAAPVAATATATTTTATTTATTTTTTTTTSETANGAFTDAKATNMRKIIAGRLAESKTTIPHFYISQECDITAVMALRQKMKLRNIKLSLNDFVIRASALALRDVEVCNRSYDASAGSARPNGSVDISVAVATPGGLITPIVTNADQKTLGQINREVKELAGRARAGTLAPEEYQGGSFSISNLGMFGIDFFSAVINPPQGIIMAVGGGVPKLARCEAGQIFTRNTMTVKLSCDRRVVDEAMAAQLAQTFRHYMEEPDYLSI